MWKLCAILSAVFAALTSIFAKMGMKGINSNLATAIRTAVVLILAWGIVFMSNGQKQIADLTKQNWIFLILSGLATGMSWLFYFRAVQVGQVSYVAVVDKLSIVLTILLAAIFLDEGLSMKAILGGLLVAAGSLVLLCK